MERTLKKNILKIQIALIILLSFIIGCTFTVYRVTTNTDAIDSVVNNIKQNRSVSQVEYKFIQNENSTKLFRTGFKDVDFIIHVKDPMDKEKLGIWFNDMYNRVFDPINKNPSIYEIKVRNIFVHVNGSKYRIEDYFSNDTFLAHTEAGELIFWNKVTPPIFTQDEKVGLVITGISQDMTANTWDRLSNTKKYQIVEEIFSHDIFQKATCIKDIPYYVKLIDARYGEDGAKGEFDVVKILQHLVMIDKNCSKMNTHT